MTTAGRAKTPDRTAAMFAPLLAALGRIEQALEDEKRALRSLSTDSLKEVGERKARCLMEVSRILRTLDGVPRPPELRTRLTDLKAKLESSRSLLHVHLTAARDVAALVAQAVDDAESDGTYSRAVSGSDGR